MTDFGALLWARWEKGESAGSIVGHWAEDESPYYLSVPPQLRELLLGMQNTLSEKYCLIVRTEDSLRNYKRDFDKILGG